jgi:hypothetical protein
MLDLLSRQEFILKEHWQCLYGLDFPAKQALLGGLEVLMCTDAAHFYAHACTLYEQHILTSDMLHTSVT